MMVVAMAGFALEDVLLKQIARSVPVGQALVLVGIGGGIVFALIARRRGNPLLSRALLLRPVLLRNLSEAVGSVTFVTALVLTTLSGASAIMQATPLAVTVGSALFLGEVVRWRRWTAIGFGFAGVLFIIQPGTVAFTPASLLAVVAVIMLATRDLASRAVPAEVSSVQLATWGFLSVIPGGLLAMLIMGTPAVPVGAGDLIRLAGALVVGCIGYYALIAATRIGELSAVVPFRYTRLVFALVLGWFVFGERPDMPMIIGATLIVGTGLYTIWRTATVQART